VVPAQTKRSLPDGQVLAPAGPVRYCTPRRELADVVASIWLTDVPPTVSSVRVLPDAAVDLVFAGGRVVVAGPDTRAIAEHLPPGPVIGMQLRPGAVSPLLGAPAAAVRDQRVPIAELWERPGQLLDDLDAVATTGTRVQLLQQACLDRLRGARVQPRVGSLRALASQGRRLDAYELGLSERQLRRSCVAAYGYPPRTLTRIVRFQAVLRQLRRDTLSLSDLAIATGHVDQPHLAHEVRAFSGLTPVALRELLHPLPDGVGPDAVVIGDASPTPPAGPRATGHNR
jgi:hypothetical protein